MSGSINVAYLLALLQFASTFLAAVVYSVLAKKLIDPVTNRIASELIEDQRGSSVRRQADDDAEPRARDCLILPNSWSLS
jgi:flagellar biosynthesis/type III secretory pathway M-ring protein FliF/YscJ